MPQVSNTTLIEQELDLLKEEVGRYREALASAFGVYTATPRATLLRLAKEWKEDHEALLALMGQRCIVCQGPATREIRDHDTWFCDVHEYGALPRAMRDALKDCGVSEAPDLEDIPFASAVRRALERCAVTTGMRN
jgi:hypothetical protein